MLVEENADMTSQNKFIFILYLQKHVTDLLVLLQSTEMKKMESIHPVIPHCWTVQTTIICTEMSYCKSHNFMWLHVPNNKLRQPSQCSDQLWTAWPEPAFQAQASSLFVTARPILLPTQGLFTGG